MTAWVEDPANADEELTYQDARVKWDCSKKQLEAAVHKLRRLGKIETPKLIRVAPTLRGF